MTTHKTYPFCYHATQGIKAIVATIEGTGLLENKAAFTPAKIMALSLTKKPVTLTVAIITLLPWGVWQQIGSILLVVMPPRNQGCYSCYCFFSNDNVINYKVAGRLCKWMPQV